MIFNEPSKLYSGAQVKAMDRAIIEAGTAGIVLMKRAGRAAFHEMVKRWPGFQLLVLCGGGNNGGDGYVIAALAQEAGLNVQLYYAKSPDSLVAEAAHAASYAEQEGVSMFPISELPDQSTISEDVLIVDALLGLGFNGSVNEPYRKAITWINQSSSPVFSVDLPSGLCSDSGEAAKFCVKADMTMSFIGRKRGLYTADGNEFAGQKRFEALGADQQVLDRFDSDVCIWNALSLRSKLSRSANSHKGRHGHVAIFGGDVGMAGAVLMTAEACLYAGAGLTSIFTRDEHISAANVRLPELMASSFKSPTDLDYDEFRDKLNRASVLCVGPGLGKSSWAELICAELSSDSRPKVIDADALNIVAESRAGLVGDQHVLTPHPGEAARLLNIKTTEIQSDRFGAVKALQKSYGGVVLLKGSGTLICDGQKTWLIPFGNPAMAVGGMGDILSGVIAALLAQGLNMLEATLLGASAHSLAADLICRDQGEIGLRATELVKIIRSIINGKTNIS